MITTPTLYALVIRVIPQRDGRLRASQGELAHAAFLDILRQADAQLAQTLHDVKGRKPFTISPLHGYRRDSKSTLSVSAGQEGWLRITLLDSQLFHTFIHYFLHSPPRAALRLGDIPFQVSEILSNPTSHFLAGYTGIEQLAKSYPQDDLEEQQRTIALTFASPTAFSIRNPDTPFRTVHVLPDPTLIFGELARYWDTLGGGQTLKAVRAFTTDAVVVAHHNIRTRMVRYRRSPQVGFTGNVAFQILDKEEPAMLAHLNRLADLAFYTGLGSKTTMGMGQVHRKKQG